MSIAHKRWAKAAHRVACEASELRTRVVNLGHSAVLVNERGDAPRFGGAGIVRGAISHRDLAVCIRQEWEVKMVVLGKL